MLLPRRNATVTAWRVQRVDVARAASRVGCAGNKHFRKRFLEALIKREPPRSPRAASVALANGSAHITLQRINAPLRRLLFGRLCAWLRISGTGFVAVQFIAVRAFFEHDATLLEEFVLSGTLITAVKALHADSFSPKALVVRRLLSPPVAPLSHFISLACVCACDGGLHERVLRLVRTVTRLLRLMRHPGRVRAAAVHRESGRQAPAAVMCDGVHHCVQRLPCRAAVTSTPRRHRIAHGAAGKGQPRVPRRPCERDAGADVIVAAVIAVPRLHGAYPPRVPSSTSRLQSQPAAAAVSAVDDRQRLMLDGVVMVVHACVQVLRGLAESSAATASLAVLQLAEFVKPLVRALSSSDMDTVRGAMGAGELMFRHYGAFHVALLRGLCGVVRAAVARVTAADDVSRTPAVNSTTVALAVRASLLRRCLHITCDVVSVRVCGVLPRRTLWHAWQLIDCGLSASFDDACPPALAAQFHSALVRVYSQTRASCHALRP